MQKYAFKMQLNAGQKDEYIRRHDAIWPELEALLRDAGVSDYSIHLDEGLRLPFIPEDTVFRWAPSQFLGEFHGREVNEGADDGEGVS